MGGISALYLQPWETVAQMDTWAPDAVYAADRVDECGQACLVMCWRWATGLWMSAAYLASRVHDMNLGPQGTTFQEMQALCRLNQTQTDLVWPKTQAELQAAVMDCLEKGWPCIPLRWWDHPNNLDSSGQPILHFCVDTGYNTGASLVQIAGPMSGTMFTETWEQHWTMFYGGLLRFMRHRRLGDH